MKPRVLIASLAAILILFTVACLLIRHATAPVSAAAPAAGLPHEAASEQVASTPAGIANAPASPTPVQQAATSSVSAPARAGSAGPQQANQGPREAEAPYQHPAEPAEDQLSASEQIVFKSRKALESVDAREFLRRGALPPK